MSEIEKLAKAVEALKRDAAGADDKRAKAFEGLIAEVGAALADLVGILESRKPTDISALVAAIKGLRFTAEAPQVKVNPVIQVAPTPIEVKNAISVAPTPIQVTNQIPAAAAPIVRVDNGQALGAQWEVSIPGLYGAADRTMTITRTK